MRRPIEAFIIILVEELKLATICRTIRENLRITLTRDDIFSAEFISSFLPSDAATVFKVLDADPTSIAACKKILNALQNLASVIERVETLPIDTGTDTAALLATIFKTVYNSTNEAYATLQLLNHSTQDMQAIIEPHLSPLLPKIAILASSLHTYTVQNHKPDASFVDQATYLCNILPTHPIDTGLRSITQILIEVPQHLAAIQKIITIPSDAMYQEDGPIIIKREVHLLSAQLESFKNSQWFNLLQNYFTTINILLHLSADLINSAAPLSGQSYKSAVKILNRIRHIHLPVMLAEIEQLEESIALKTGLLTRPILQQLDKYYSKLAEQVNNIAAAASALDKTANKLSAWYVNFLKKLLNNQSDIQQREPLEIEPNLGVMQDTLFQETRQQAQLIRLHEARFASKDQRIIAAAEEFFAQLNGFYKI